MGSHWFQNKFNVGLDHEEERAGVHEVHVETPSGTGTVQRDPAHPENIVVNLHNGTSELSDNATFLPGETGHIVLRNGDLLAIENTPIT